jgi:hypothetical protein
MASDLRRVPSSGAVDVGYPTGHFGHLTEEDQALVDFKALLQDKGLYQPGPPPSHSDPTLLYVLLSPDGSAIALNNQRFLLTDGVCARL